MRVVLDTNVLLSALISSKGAPDTIYRAWRAGRFAVVTSAEQLDELRRVSRYPKLKAILPAHRVGALVNNLQAAEVLQSLPPPPTELALHDPYDAFLWAMAIAGNADFLVTGDRRAGLLQLGTVGRARVMLPNGFCNLLP